MSKGGRHGALVVTWTQPYRAACAALAASPGWGAGVSEVPCHPQAPVLTYKAAGADATLFVCLTCLQGYVDAQGLLIGPDDARRDPQPKRTCHRCNQEHPLSDFVARSGAITVYCTSCRLAWGKAKREAEEQELQVAMVGAANSLRRLMKDLSE